MWMVLTLALLSPAQAKEEPCKSCWNASCAELKDFGVPACKAAKPKPTAKRLKPTKTEPKTGLVWVSMPAGSFHYGCEPQDTQCFSDEKPGRRATVGAFWMLQTEVTVGAYRRCMNAGACTAPDGGGLGAASEPVTEVDAEQAGTFCKWVGGRLPTAVEWEYAAKSGSSRIYPWGDSSPTGTKANCDGCGDRFEGLAAVGSLPAGDTQWGLKDIAGNVWEWADSVGSISGWELRGGSWVNTPKNLRASGSKKCGPGWRDAGIGFRCAQ